MKTNKNHNNTKCFAPFKLRRVYVCPDIVQVKLDNAISLALESEPPYGPDETYQQNRQQSNNCFYV